MSERRRYFRIEDRALVKYRQADEHDVLPEQRLRYMEYINRESARVLFNGINTRIEEVLLKLRNAHPEFSELGDLLNRKVNLLERMLNFGEAEVGSDEEFPGFDLRDVNLSASGIAIHGAPSLPLGTRMEIDIILLPEYQHIKAFCRVAAYRREDGVDTHALAMDFEHIRDEDRDRIVQHSVARQSDTLRARRLSHDDA